RSLFMAHEGNKHGLRLKFVTSFLTLVTVEQLRLIFPGKDDAPLAAFVIWLRKFAAQTTMQIFDTFKQIKGTDRGENLEKIMKWLFSWVKFVPYIKANVTTDEIGPVIERYQDNYKDEHGKGFDLLCCDYPGLLNTDRGSKGNYAQRQIKQEVYEFYSALAGQHDWHSLVAIQVNREGSKINSGIRRDGSHGTRASRLLGN